MKKATIFSAFLAVTGLFTGAESAFAVDSSSSVWTQQQPTIKSKAQTGFDDTPFQQVVQQERLQLNNAEQFELDPTKLFLKYDHDVTAYFINEGAGYRNQLAYEATGTTNKTGLIFSDVSSTESIGNWGGDALKLGDGVNIGKISGGTQLDFWLRADGLNRGVGANVFGTATSSNADRLQHAVAYGIGKYIMIGFEDLYGALGAWGEDTITRKSNEGSDRDFNDVVFVVDVGEANMKALKGQNGYKTTPEPSMLLALMGVGGIGMLKRRQKAQSA